MTPLSLGIISMHTSPIDLPGSGDAGGMNVVESAQARSLAALGHRVHMVTRRSDPSQPALLQLGDGVDLHVVDAGPARRLAKSDIDQYIEEFRDGLWHLAEHCHWDLVHSHHWMSGVAALPVAKAAGIPHVQSFHSVAALPGTPLSDGEPPESPGRVAGERLVALDSDAVVAISTAEARTVVERCGADPARVTIVWPGVDGEVFHPLRPGEARFALPGDPDLPNGYLAYAARLQPLKGPDLALRALAHVEKWRRPHLVIAGDTAEDFAGYAQELHQLVGKLGLTQDVTFIGPQGRGDLARLLRGAQIVLVPSHSETFGLIALEAAASGVPVLASSAGGLREAVAHQETGQLIDSREPEDWGRAITHLMTTGGLIPRMGTVARIHASRFDWMWTARRLEEIYRQTIAAGAAAQTQLPDFLEGVRRVVVVHAHPDDETLATGALVAHLSRTGVDVRVLTATRGERGGVVTGVDAPEPGTPAFADLRELELAGALGALGVAHGPQFLGAPPARAEGLTPRRYLDSGMRWITPTLAGPADNASHESLTSAGVAEVAGDVAAYLRSVDPDLVLTYDKTGGYGHPDHVRVREAVELATSSLGLPLVEVLPPGPSCGAAGVVEVTLSEEQRAVIDALQHHRTQLTVVGAEVVHQGGQREPILLTATLRRVPSSTVS